MSTKSNFSLGLVMLVFTSLSQAGIGEGDWDLAKGETVIKALNYSGVVYGCESFSPKAVSFIIKYNYLTSGHFPMVVKADKTSKVSHNTNNHTYTVTDATSLEIRLPSKRKYEITNTTGSAIKGQNCDTGSYD